MDLKIITGKKGKIDVSISIVSMNNLHDLEVCIDSILNYTYNINYEIFVNAYKYSELNYSKLVKKYGNNSLIHILRIDGIKGYSENHNLLLKNANGEYCLILNDDTYFVDNSIKMLLETLKLYKYIDIIYPIILNTDGTIQTNGRAKYTPFYYIASNCRIISFFKSKYENKNGIFKTYNISGACFMIKNSILKKLNYFDERFFFIPEDLALSTKANRLGYSCYVNSDCKIFHINSSTTKKMRSVIIPTAKQGLYIYFRDEYGKIVEKIIRVVDIFINVPKLLSWYFSKNCKKKSIMIKTYKNVIRYSFVKINPKILFIKLNDLDK